MTKKINIITSIRPGGPLKWGATLAEQLNKRKLWKASHIHTLPLVILSPFYQACDVVHTTLPITYRLWKKPTILTIRGNFKIEKNPWSWMYPKAIEMANIVTVGSLFLKNTLNLRQAIVIPPAIEIPKILQNSNKNRPFDTLYLLTVTKFYFPEKAKGVLKMIKAISLLKEPKIPFTISILGGGPYLNKIEKEAKKSGLPVQFYGFTDPKQFLQRADIFLYWSDHDNTPIAILEAMSYGLPIVTNNVGAIPELIEHEKTGFIANSEHKFAEYLCCLLHDPMLRLRIGQSAQAAIRQKFNYDTIVPLYETLYRKLV